MTPTRVVDRTGDKNYAWYALNDQDGMVCLRIYVPAANHLELRQKDTVAEAFVTPDPGLPPKLIVLRPVADGRHFRVSKCFSLTQSQNSQRPKRVLISCEKPTE